MTIPLHLQRQKKNNGGNCLSKDYKKPILSLSNILIFLLVIVAIVNTVLWVKSNTNPEKRTIEKEVSDLEKDIEFYETSQKTYTPTEVNKKISEDKINVKESFEKKEKDIKKGVTQVYDKTKTEEDYNDLEDVIKDDLGGQFTDKLVSISKPIINESGKEQLPYDDLEDVSIAFGEYDIVEHTAKTYVLVTYKSSEIDANNPGVEREDKQVQIGGQDFFILDYNLKDDSLSLFDYQQNKKIEVVNE